MAPQREYLRWPSVRLFDGETVRLDALFELPPIVYQATRTGNGVLVWPEMPGNPEHFTLLAREPATLDAHATNTRTHKRRTIVWLPCREDVREGQADQRLAAWLRAQLVGSSHLVVDPRALPRFGTRALVPLPSDMRELAPEREGDSIDLRIFTPVPLGTPWTHAPGRVWVAFGLRQCLGWIWSGWMTSGPEVLFLPWHAGVQLMHRLMYEIGDEDTKLARAELSG